MRACVSLCVCICSRMQRQVKENHLSWEVPVYEDNSAKTLEVQVHSLQVELAHSKTSNTEKAALTSNLAWTMRALRACLPRVDRSRSCSPPKPGSTTTSGPGRRPCWDLNLSMVIRICLAGGVRTLRAVPHGKVRPAQNPSREIGRAQNGSLHGLHAVPGRRAPGALAFLAGAGPRERLERRVQISRVQML